MISGIYGYYDKEKKYVCYIGQSVNINKRHKDHYQKCRYDKQNINRILQNNPNRYYYFILAEGNFSDDKLNDMEEQAIEIFKTYKYDYPERSVFNFTKGGDRSTGYKHTQAWKGEASERNSGRNNPMCGAGKSGILYVSQIKDKKCKQGYFWRYRKIINGKKYQKKSVNLRKLEKNVLKDNQEWIILDKEKAKQSYQESDKNNKR